jgi:aerotaxis receptor
VRNNQPVTQREVECPDGVTLMSTTDAQSHIIYANDAFCSLAGFSHKELQGQPHNIVRHPDMPGEAFADMWATLKGGEPWTGLVKNRAQNGDHYWVRANAAPVIRGGRHVGYTSVRTKATRTEIAGVEGLYRKVREGRAGSLRFHKGLVIRTGPMAWTSALQTMPVRWRIRWALVALVLATVVGAGALGLAGARLAGFAGLASAAALLASQWLEAQIARPLERMREQALGMATGEQEKVAELDRVDEIGMTLRSINQLGLMFRWVVDDVSRQVLNVQTATNEIAQGNGDLAVRTEQAAASVQETASSMEEMTASVKSNADTAGQANELAGSASQAAARGGHAVANVVTTMNGITDSSKRISDIIGVIDGIAFQTNILALNAAVEAARAGEQGRGFAVVASEVRNLALRSVDAAKEIKSLIGASVESVESGTRMVDDAGRAMDDIVTQVKRVSGLIAEISTATNEQSSGIRQIGTAVDHLDDITQQNAALVEETTAASESLRQQMMRLSEAVGVFN